MDSQHATLSLGDLIAKMNLQSRSEYQCSPRWTLKEAEDLQNQAEEFVSEAKLELNYVTRDKSREYFKKIMDKHDFLMRKYVKDDYGSPENPINGRLDGLFFRANLRCNKKKPISPFGDRRIQMPASELLTPDKHLYFADFYCMYRAGCNPGPLAVCNKHNVTLVLCEPDSDSDQFCRRYLPALDIRNNHFLFIDDDNGDDDTIYVASDKGKYGVFVEILYTEDMDIFPLLPYFKDVKQWVQRRDPNPKKNKTCEHCNLT